MKRIIFPLLALISLCGCYNDKAELLYPVTTCDTSSITYSGVVGPILMTNCATADGCHKTKDAAGSAGVALDNVAGAQAIAKSGQLMAVINHAPGYPEMPKNLPKLDQCTIRKIGIWVEQGAPNN